MESETKPVNPPKTGSYLALTLEVIDGPSAGRKLWTNLNLENENPVAVKIAYEQLAAICYVTGVINCEDSQQLHGIPFQAKVSIRTQEGRDPSNDIKGYRDAYGNEPKDIATGNVGAGAAAAPGAPPVPQAPTAPSIPQAPGVPSAPVAPPVVAAPPPHDPMAAAMADGWAVHPSDPAWMYKGADVKTPADVAALYPAPAAPVGAPAVPAAPVAPVAPPAAATTGAAVPPWAKPGA